MTFMELCRAAIDKPGIDNNWDGIKVAHYALKLINELQVDIKQLPITKADRVCVWTNHVLPRFGDSEFMPRHVVELLESVLDPDDLDEISLALIMKHVRKTLLERVSRGELIMTQEGKSGKPFIFKNLEK